MTLVQGHDTPLGQGQQMCEILSIPNMAVRSYGPDTGFWVCVHCDLDLGDMTLGQGHDTPLDHGQQFNEIISRLDKGVQSYGPDTMSTDGQTDRVIPIYPPQTLFAGGYNKVLFACR